MTNLLRTWIHAHLDAPLDSVWTRLDETGMDDVARHPSLLEAPSVGRLRSTATVSRAAADRRGAHRVAH
jgi:hypothetical protein